MHFKSIAAACLAASLSSSVFAQASESRFAQLGKWSVSAVWSAPGKFFYCGATLSNGKADLRIATDGQTWEIGTRHPGKKGTVSAYYGFGVAGEVANLQLNGDGWATMRIDADQLKAFRSLPEFSLNIGKSEQTWPLGGAAAAIDQAMACARQRGVTKAAAPDLPPVGQARLFGPGFDGWSFTATTEKPGLVNCRAIRKVAGREDILAMHTNWKPYISVRGEGRHGKWKDMSITISGSKKREWLVPSEANGERLWFQMPDFAAVGEIAAAGQYRFSMPDSEETGVVPLGKRAAEAWARVNKCVQAHGG